jgi:hypothetical protein
MYVYLVIPTWYDDEDIIVFDSFETMKVHYEKKGYKINTKEEHLINPEGLANHRYEKALVNTIT